MQFVIEHLKKGFEEKEVLRDINFTFEQGKIYGLLGRNGAGKTTLFNCLNNDLNIEMGRFYLYDGKEHNVDMHKIGYVTSTPTVPEFLTGREFLQFFIDINKDNIQDLKTIDEYFDIVGIKQDDRDRLLKDYSHGMANKMQMLVNLIYNPFILLLDEPLTSLDIVAADEMKKILRNIRENHILILSTHIMELAMELCDEIVILNHGVLQSVERNQDKIITLLKDDNYD
ncbi:MAG: ABC transporter ATP-binding protein [Erysipelotrichaceae bacterium]|nr:ABC transporter ATP-binding protein [Erysipelotrichaceae bacterium]